MTLIDTHCHLNFKAFSDDYLEVAKKNFDNGVTKIVIVGSDPQTSERALEIAKTINTQLPGFASVAVGIHAIHTDRIDFEKIEELSKDPLVAAIGETGIDFFHDKERSTEKEQIDLFKRHIELALSLGKPLIIHNREADEVVTKTIEMYPEIKKAVLHCFSSDHNMAKWAIDKGLLLSFTGNITYGNKKIKKVLERTSIEKMMLETDSPYLVPEPIRSQESIARNEPMYAIETAKKIAEIKNLSLEEVLEATTENAERFFQLQ